MKITDFERVAEVNVHLGQFKCPKCGGICTEKISTDDYGKNPPKPRIFDCERCGRGFEEMPDWVKTVSDAHHAAENRENYNETIQNR